MKRPVMAICGVLAFAVASLAKAESPPISAAPDSAAQKQQVDLLVSQLGAGSYAKRQDASRELVKVGVPAIPALRVALKSSDAEVRKRAAKVLENVREVDFQARLEAFAMDVDGSRDIQLPAWSVFRNRVGDDSVARNIFVEMQRSESRLLEALDAGDLKTCSDLLRTRALANLQSIQNPTGQTRRVPISMGAVAAMLMVASTDDVLVEDHIGNQLNQLVYQSSYRLAASAGTQAPLLKKILSQWIIRDHTANQGYYDLMLAFNFDLPEGLDVARRLVKQEGLQVHVIPYAIVGVGRFGSQADMKLLEPLLKNTHICSQQNISDRVVVKTQVRDVALAMLVHLSKQNLKDYGFDKATPSPQFVYTPNSLGFTEEKAREAAFKKWDEWKAAQAATSSN